MSNYKSKSRASFDSKAEYYLDTSDHKVTLKLKEKALEDITIYNDQKILDIGCGIGDVLEQMNLKADKARLYGIDYSQNMIKMAKLRLQDKASLIVGDAENLPYKDNEFDIITTCATFHHLPNPTKAIEEMKRVLKVEGRLYIYDYTVPTIFRKFINLFIRFSPGGDYKIYSGKEIKALLIKSGYRNIEIEKISMNGFCVNGYK